MKIEDIYRDLPIIETPRLLLRKLSMDDLDSMFEYASDDLVSRFVTWDTHKTKYDTLQFITYILRKYENFEVAPWAIELKEEKKYIGTIDFVWWKPEQNSAEIGYAISPKYWSKGYTTEAAKAVIAFGFNHMELVRIQARCYVDNIASQRVMEKAGMTYEGTLRKSLFAKGKHQDIKMFSILRDEFINSK